ncbi:hypothetical protein [Paenibacillus polysaccharolyticus]|uniref:hypothetical protein n=1 Tax=Paenibacillus polysaccharolyticus TaxID=582692 RepID=UPI00300B3DC3
MLGEVTASKEREKAKPQLKATKMKGVTINGAYYDRNRIAHIMHEYKHTRGIQ